MKRTAIILLAFVSIFVAYTAWAYVPPSAFMIKTMAAKHTGGAAAKGLKIVSLVSFVINGKPGAVHFKQTTAYWPQNDTLVSTATDDQGQVLYSQVGKLASAPISSQVLLESNPGVLTDLLIQNHLPVGAAGEALFLSRWNSQTAWVVGTDNALWIEKDTFLPLRLLLGDVETRYENYRSYREFQYPRTVSILNKGTASFQAETQEMSVGAEAVSKISTENLKSGFSEAGNVASSDIRELISKYYEYFR